MTVMIAFLILRSFPLSQPQQLSRQQEIPDDAVTSQPQSSRHIEPSKFESKSWQCWDNFDITEVNRPWTLKKSNIRKTIDCEIHCSLLDEKTGQQSSWKTTDSKRQSSTSNMVEHLRKRHYRGSGTARASKETEVFYLCLHRSEREAQESRPDCHRYQIHN
ncbi:hypothetical protein V1517DRAFT_362771 [Lipomyces orientalis]|uniref:Uncharacterized protein n=1 Tax=Lipomyces orientalis TaxID=1233043 RepID=A0ACC3TK70_9ASCO